MKQPYFVNRKPSCRVTCNFAFDLLEKLLEPSPVARITASEALCHQFFGGEVHAVHLNFHRGFRGWALFSDFRIHIFRFKVIWNLTQVIILSIIPSQYDMIYRKMKISTFFKPSGVSAQKNLKPLKRIVDYQGKVISRNSAYHSPPGPRDKKLSFITSLRPISSNRPPLVPFGNLESLLACTLQMLTAIPFWSDVGIRYFLSFHGVSQMRESLTRDSFLNHSFQNLRQTFEGNTDPGNLLERLVCFFRRGHQCLWKHRYEIYCNQCSQSWQHSNDSLILEFTMETKPIFVDSLVQDYYRQCLSTDITCPDCLTSG